MAIGDYDQSTSRVNEITVFTSATEQPKWLQAVLATSSAWRVVDIRQRAEARELAASKVLPFS